MKVTTVGDLKQQIQASGLPDDAQVTPLLEAIQVDESSATPAPETHLDVRKKGEVLEVAVVFVEGG